MPKNDSDPEAYSHEGDRDAEDRSISEGKENARAGNSQSKWRGFASENARGTVSSTIASLNSRPNPAPKPPNSMMGQVSTFRVFHPCDTADLFTELRWWQVCENPS